MLLFRYCILFDHIYKKSIILVVKFLTTLEVFMKVENITKENIFNIAIISNSSIEKKCSSSADNKVSHKE